MICPKCNGEVVQGSLKTIIMCVNCHKVYKLIEVEIKPISEGLKTIKFHNITIVD